MPRSNRRAGQLPESDSIDDDDDKHEDDYEEETGGFIKMQAYIVKALIGLVGGGGGGMGEEEPVRVQRPEKYGVRSTEWVILPSWIWGENPRRRRRKSLTLFIILPLSAAIHG